LSRACPSFFYFVAPFASPFMAETVPSRLSAGDRSASNFGFFFFSLLGNVSAASVRFGNSKSFFFAFQESYFFSGVESFLPRRTLSPPFRRRAEDRRLTGNLFFYMVLLLCFFIIERHLFFWAGSILRVLLEAVSGSFLRVLFGEFQEPHRIMPFWSSTRYSRDFLTLQVYCSRVHGTFQLPWTGPSFFSSRLSFSDETFSLFLPP